MDVDTELGFLSDSGSDGYVPDDAYHNQNHQSYEPVLQEAKRRGVSLQALHAIMNLMLVVTGHTEKKDFISYTKLRNQWKRIGGELAEEHSQIGGYEYLGFDGKKSTILAENNRTEKNVDKITVIDQSMFTYVDHGVPESGHSISVANLLFDVAKKTNSVKTIKSLSSDSPNVNTGWKNGAIRKFEELIENEVQHLNCDLHLNEKLFEKVFITVGKRSSIYITKLICLSVCTNISEFT